MYKKKETIGQLSLDDIMINNNENKEELNITPTDSQNIEIKKIINWFKNEPEKQIYKLGGYAGTGKTTIVKFIIKELNIENKVEFVAYTGMAASVLLRKGNKNAKTIHKLIYIAIPIENKETGQTYFKFELKDELDKDINLIVVDEFSMVDEKIIKDLLSFNIKILAIGDPAQLTPVAGCNPYMNKMDGVLTEILRQELDNPIIYISKLAREGMAIKYGNYGDTVKVIPNNKMNLKMIKEADQILAGKNDTVSSFNEFYRTEIKHIEFNYPVKGDKVLCLKNDWNYLRYTNNIEVYLVNGLMGIIDSDIINFERTKLYKFDFRPLFFNEDDFPFRELYVDKLKFLRDNNEFDKKLYFQRKFVQEKFGIQNFSYGYCTTVHKFQGSESNNILLINEVLNRNTYNNWLYTGITRAKEKLIIVV